MGSKKRNRSPLRDGLFDLLLCQDATLVNSCASQPTTVPTDHELICTTLTLPLTPSVTTVQSETRDLRKIDIKAFCDDLRKADLDTFPPEAEQNVDAMWTSWTEKFFSVLDKHAPLITKRSRGTITHVHRLCDAHWCTGLVFVKVVKAFDRVQHQQLVNIFAGIGVEGTALDWFVSYLSDRRQQVKSGISLGEVKVCSRGVPQGSVLGPLLFKSHCTHATSLHY